MKRSVILLIACSFFLSACDEPPEKPTLEICVVDVESSQCVCGTKKPNQPVSDLRREPMIYCQNATALRPDEWEKYKNYVDGLEAFIDRIRREAEKK